MQKKIPFVILIILLCTTYFNIKVSANNNVNSSLLSTAAFPSAQGGGMYSKGARGAENPEIYHVTTLEDGGKGSLRDAVSKGGRIIVFDVGGNIKLKDSLSINKDNITILGQTAPGDGISIDNECVKISGSNIILRYLRFRMGSKTREEDTVTVHYGHDIIIDHCSMSWSIDECLSFYAVKNFTVQWSIISESLNNSIHIKGAHGMGGIWGGINSSAHHNLLSTHNNRNPMIGTGATVSSYNNTPDTDGLIDVRNNVVYNWGNSPGYGGQNGVRVNLVGNYYRPGPATKPNKTNLIYTLNGTESESQSLIENGGTAGGGKGKIGWSTTLFADKNYIENDDSINADNWLGIKKGTNVGYWENSWIKCENIYDGIYVNGELKPNDQYIYDYPIITQSADKAYDNVIQYAGASKIRDSVDIRVINNVINKTAPTGSKSGLGLIDSPDDVGGYPVLNGSEKPLDSDNDGMPDYWEDENGYNKNNPDDAVIILDDGYMPIEKYGEYLILPDNTEIYDKTELLQELYNDLKIKKYGYNENSWINFTKALENAQNIAGMPYPSEKEISDALEEIKSAVSSLETDDKYYLKELIAKAKNLNSAEYIQNSFNEMLITLASASAICDAPNSDKSEIDTAFNNLKNAIDNLQTDYKYKLENEINKIGTINQMFYSIETLNNFINETKKSRQMLNENHSMEEIKAQYESLKSHWEKLFPSKDRETRITGDFENMLCLNIGSGNYGNYTTYSETDDNSFFIKQNIFGNLSKSLVINDESTKRLGFTRKFDKKQKGIIKLKEDFCFLSKPTGETIFFRVADSNYSGLSSNNLFDISVFESYRKPYLRFRNYTTPEISYVKIGDTELEENKWYTVEVDIDTIKKQCSVLFEDKIYSDSTMTLYADNIGINRFSVESPGSASAVFAVDNINVSAGDEKYGTDNLQISDNWTSGGIVDINTDIINYNGDKNVAFITASYENNKLIDFKIQKITTEKNSKTENLSAKLRLGNNIENCKIKIFIWNKSMTPYYNISYKGSKN